MLLRNEPNSLAKNSVLSIAYIYKDCKGTFYGTAVAYDTSICNTFNLNDKILEPFLDSDCTLFRLRRQDSPFEKKFIWLLSDADYAGDLDAQKEVTTDYYQYCIVIQNSKEAKSFKK